VRHDRARFPFRLHVNGADTTPLTSSNGARESRAFLFARPDRIAASSAEPKGDQRVRGLPPARCSRASAEAEGAGVHRDPCSKKAPRRGRGRGTRGALSRWVQGTT
jgi:hypothetical protein